mmetsp:Transcript_22261/g.31103  ORF Transcript_22261/g.31103 Transcript_22261/m.31103 type:complete len:142 (+) Transcript_22261:82-507(+)|eukprot:CAMPEP_0184488246 /NCGR_PEP_ID=MMETSP0113_2-20130426/10618_1 /TAXON_ID=91329 /ORGANISM="Norrisiella sphaerica, Strain BC52" /LENGTH=141 /DNA_ID=CAMNT_0026870759 /DNA_START=55 /DNA_END=480 /DNA_ORIENTATION=-
MKLIIAVLLLTSAAYSLSSELPDYSFASPCELEAAKFYCHIAPHDSFCSSGVLNRCVQIKDQCQGFNAQHCPAGANGCCECAFRECPFDEEGCDFIAKKCPGLDPTFHQHIEIAKLSGTFSPGKIPIKINSIGSFMVNVAK